MLHVLVARQLAAMGQRHTAARRRLVDVVASADGPLRAAVILELAGLPVSTAYRNLQMLCRAGVLSFIPGIDRQDRFSLADQLRDDHHRHHLVCVKCGTMSDYVAPPEIEAMIAGLAPWAATSRNFQVASHTLDLVGVCGSCVAGGETANPAPA